MHNTAEIDFYGSIHWIEDQSVDTSGSAYLSAAILKKHNTNRIALVSNAWHMPRAVAKFKSMGLSVIPAPIGFVYPEMDALSFLPYSSALDITSRALHEWLGFWADHKGL